MESQGYSCISQASISDENSPEHFKAKFFIVWAKAVPLVFLAFCTITFNSVVLWMLKVKRSLRSCKNIYLASLALADLIIGLCIFLAIFQQLKSHVEWLPLFWCRCYLILRQSALYVSLLSLVLITGDRWWSIQYPFSYRARRRKRNSCIAVGCVWLFGFVVHVPPVIWDGGTSLNESNDTILNEFAIVKQTSASCELSFSHNILLMSIVSVVQYLIPLMVMLSLNGSLYLGILRRKRVQIRRSVSVSDRLTCFDRRTSICSIPELNSVAEERIHLLNGISPRHFQSRPRAMRRNSADIILLRSSASSAPCSTNPQSGQRNRRFSWAPGKTSMRPIKRGEELAKTLLVKQDRRAAFWLGLLVIVFLVCWLPHTIVGILQANKHMILPQWAKDVTFWFLMINSTVNPLMYGFFNREIRRSCKQWFCGETSRKWRVKNALALYGIGLTTAVVVPRRVSAF